MELPSQVPQQEAAGAKRGEFFRGEECEHQDRRADGMTFWTPDGRTASPLLNPPRFPTALVTCFFQVTLWRETAEFGGQKPVLQRMSETMETLMSSSMPSLLRRRSLLGSHVCVEQVFD